MKKIAFFICLGFSVLFAKSLEEIYLENGIVAVQNAIESNLQSKDYWSNKIKDMDLRYGYYEDDKLLTIVDKKSKNIFLYEYKNGKLNKKFNHEILTGLMGDKLKEGDLKTPVGVYNITRRFVPSDTYYGPVAFSLSYPNIYDQARDRTGGGIWIHGFPMQGVVREDTLKTKGVSPYQIIFWSNMRSLWVTKVALFLSMKTLSQRLQMIKFLLFLLSFLSGKKRGVTAM